MTYENKVARKIPNLLFGQIHKERIWIVRPSQNIEKHYAETIKVSFWGKKHFYTKLFLLQHRTRLSTMNQYLLHHAVIRICSPGVEASCIADILVSHEEVAIFELIRRTYRTLSKLETFILVL